MALKLLLNPLAEGAYFADLTAVATAELRAHFPGCEVTEDRRAALTFLDVALGADAAPTLARLSFVQGIFAPAEGDQLRLLDEAPGYLLPADLVWGAKYRGKTHELVTQLAINVALASCEAKAKKGYRLLDPMAGRGTTLLWAARYGIDAWGIEQDPQALSHMQRHVKRQTKLHRIKHKQQRGSVGRRRKDGVGQFLEFRFLESATKLITGDSRGATNLLNDMRFHLIVSDLPYGIQHTAPGGTRDPLELLASCAPGWAASLRKGGAMVLIFNRFQPSRGDLIEVFTDQGLDALDFEAPHRMSESILRDLVVFRRPR